MSATAAATNGHSNAQAPVKSTGEENAAPKDHTDVVTTVEEQVSGGAGNGAGAGGCAASQRDAKATTDRGAVVGSCDSAALAKIASAVEDILEALGEDPRREGLRRTPMRVAKALAFITGGSATSVETMLNDAIFRDADSEGELVIVKDIELHSVCEHHMLPFTGKAHVGYVSDGRIVGLSKVARMVHRFSRALQVQERITRQVAQCLLDTLAPPGVAVVIEATHMCMSMRGVRAHGASTVTTCFKGVLKTDKQLRREFLDLVRG